MYVSQRTATTSRISKTCSVPTGRSATCANATNIADKAAKQCRGDVGVYTADGCCGESHCTLLPTVVSPRRHQMSPRIPRRMRRRPHQRRRRRDDADQDPALPRLPGQSFAIEHRVREKKNKFIRPFLGADVDDPRRFIPCVFIGSFRTTWNCGGSLSGVCLRTLCHFPILRFRALECHLR